ncbi:MAG: hypothetical protein RI885_2275 [Actinomycetota bacterium]
MSPKKSKWAKTPGALGGPPKGYAYDPRLIQGQRDAARASAASSIDEVVELWKLIVTIGLKTARAIHAGDGTATLGKTVETLRSAAVGDEDAREVRTEKLPNGGLTWDDCNRAAENLADRIGLSRKTELELAGSLSVPKMFAVGTYRDKDGELRELPVDPDGDPRSST